MKPQDIDLHRVTSTAIIHKNGKYLIVKRNPELKVFPGKWAVPGGGLKINDYENMPKTTADAWYHVVENSLRREIKEEVGLEINKPEYLCDLAFIRPDMIPVVALSYYCNWKEGEVKLNYENVDFKWVTPEEAGNYDLIDGILKEIKTADKLIKKRSTLKPVSLED